MGACPRRPAQRRGHQSGVQHPVRKPPLLDGSQQHAWIYWHPRRNESLGARLAVLLPVVTNRLFARRKRLFGDHVLTPSVHSLLFTPRDLYFKGNFCFETSHLIDLASIHNLDSDRTLVGNRGLNYCKGKVVPRMIFFFFSFSTISFGSTSRVYEIRKNRVG